MLYVVIFGSLVAYILAARAGLVNPVYYKLLIRIKELPSNIKQNGWLEGLLIWVFGQYQKNPKGAKLTEDEKRAINIGGILAEQNGAFYDSLETGVFKQKLYEMLSEWYDITSKDSAEDTISHFLNDGHNVEYKFIAKYVVEDNEDSFIQTPEARDENRRYYEFFFKLKEAVDVLIEEKIINDKKDLLKIDAYAWDAGRAVYVARACYDMKFLTKEEAWDYIMKAYQKSKAIYSSWEEFAQAYVVGRAMWGGNSGSLNGIVALEHGLLNDNNSPWKEISFK